MINCDQSMTNDYLNQQMMRIKIYKIIKKRKSIKCLDNNNTKNLL